MLITKTIPKGYAEYASLLSDSVKYKYLDKHEKKLKYYSITFTDLINRLLEKNKQLNFLITEEKEFLDLLNKNFKQSKNQWILFEDYLEMVKKGFLSLEKRLEMIKKELTLLMKKNNLDSSDIDNKYLCTINNIQNQLLDIRNQLTKMKKFEDKDKKILITAKIVVENYLEIIISIASKDFDSIDDIYSSTLNVRGDSFMKLNLDNKIIA